MSSQSDQLRIEILGIGEITTTIELVGPPERTFLHPVDNREMRVAYKKLPPFETREEAEAYRRTVREYEEFLETRMDIPLPWYDHWLIRRRDGKWIVYNVQERLPSAKVACLAWHSMSPEAALRLHERIVEEVAKITAHNRAHPDYLIGFDPQVSNWVIEEFDAANPDFRGDERMIYIDTSTPMIRAGGVEQMNAEMFLMALPSMFRGFARRFLLQDILDRYYSPRDVLKDLLASYHTHRRPELVPPAVESMNRRLTKPPFDTGIRPFSAEEIRKYHKGDVVIWHFFRTLKRIDRWIGERFYGRTYEQRLPRGTPRKWKNLVGAGGPGLSAEDS